MPLGTHGAGRHDVASHPLSVGLRTLGYAGPGRVADEREIGEIQARGAEMGHSYWRNAEATTARWQDGWLLTGDQGYLAESGVHSQITSLK